MKSKLVEASVHLFGRMAQGRLQAVRGVRFYSECLAWHNEPQRRMNKSMQLIDIQSFHRHFGGQQMANTWKQTLESSVQASDAIRVHQTLA